MASRRHHGLIAQLRGDIALFAWLCLFVLAVPVLQPFAEARAAERGDAFIICTQFGETRAAIAGSDDLPIGAADDCPAGIVCMVATPAPPVTADGDGLPRPLPVAATPKPTAKDSPAPAGFAWLRPPGRAPPLSL